MFSVTIKFKPISLNYEPAIIAGLNKTVDEAEKDFNATIATFSGRSQFRFVKRPAARKGNMWVASISTDNENYVRLVRGTGPRPRDAKSSYGMRFRANYTPRTRPGRIGSGASSRSGPWRRKMHVVSGPIEARNFDRQIAEMRGPDLPKNITNEMKKVKVGK